MATEKTTIEAKGNVTEANAEATATTTSIDPVLKEKKGFGKWFDSLHTPTKAIINTVIAVGIGAAGFFARTLVDAFTGGGDNDDNPADAGNDSPEDE